SMSGIALMFPYQTAMFSQTFAFINSVTGLELATNLSLIQEQQLASLWHAAMAIFLIAVILAHIYIGSLGMEGAFDAMGSGEVDANWAREHHSIWYEEEVAKARETRSPEADGAAPAPAE
ncbi:MAG: formate dehydrogenase subunit gamma, partial [Pseudomonadota bacterium]